MNTDGRSGGALAHISYQWLCAALLATTLGEWVLFVERHLWVGAERLLVPGLLLVSGLKFLLVISWLMSSGATLGFVKRMVLVTLAMSGGAIILLLLLLK